MIELERLLWAVNKITSYHRHGRKVLDKDSTRLSNRQVEYEEALREQNLQGGTASE